MAPKEGPPDSGPPLDPFGAEDPAWERYEGISWLRRVAQSWARSSADYRPPRRRGELLSAMIVGAVGMAVLVGAVVALFWLGGALISLFD